MIRNNFLKATVCIMHVNYTCAFASLATGWLVAVSGYDQRTTHTHLLVISSSDSALCLWLSKATLRGLGQPSQLSLQAAVHAACPTHSQWEASGFIDGFRVSVQEDDS